MEKELEIKLQMELNLLSTFKSQKLTKLNRLASHNKKKLNILRKKDCSSSSKTTTLLKQKWVFNIRSKKLIQPQNAVLEKRFNVAITLKFILKLDIITGIEVGLHTVSDEAAVHIACSKIFEVLQSAKPPQETSCKRKRP